MCSLRSIEGYPLTVAHLPHVDELATVPAVPEVAFVAGTGKGHRVDKGLVLLGALLLMLIHRLLPCVRFAVPAIRQQPSKD
jgi:hypothetical protein